MYSLAHANRTTEQTLSELNEGLSSATLKAGAIIKLPTADAPATAEQPADTLTVRPPAEKTPDARAGRRAPLVVAAARHDRRAPQCQLYRILSGIPAGRRPAPPRRPVGTARRFRHGARSREGRDTRRRQHSRPLATDRRPRVRRRTGTRPAHRRAGGYSGRFAAGDDRSYAQRRPLPNGARSRPEIRETRPAAQQRPQGSY